MIGTTLLKIFRKLYVKDADLNKVQDSIAQILNPVAKVPFLDGTMLKDLQVTTSAQKFSHNLNRDVTGWFLVGKQGLGDVYSASSTTTTIVLQSSVNVTCSIWVY